MEPDRREPPPRTPLSELCKVAGCGRRRLGSSDLCADHLNERLRLERESRERAREKAGNWAAWAAPEPALWQVAGTRPTEAEASSARVEEELVVLRAEVSGMLDRQVARIPWPELLQGLGPAQVLKRFERSLAMLPPEREVEAWRAIRAVVEGRREEVEETLGRLDAAVREPASLLLRALGGASAEAPPAEPAGSGGSAAPGGGPGERRPLADVTEGLADLAGDLARKAADVARAAASAVPEGAPAAAAAAAHAATGALREALHAGEERFREAGERGGVLDPANLIAIAGEAAAAAASRLRDLVEPSLVRYLTRGLVDPVALRRTIDRVGEVARSNAAIFRRRLAGRYETDAYGLDRDLVEFFRPLLRFLYRRYFRVETSGIEHVPARGRALIVANRSGVLPWDAAMIATAIVEERRPGPRDVRLLVLDWLAGVPFAAELLQKMGMLLARPENGARLLEADELVAVFPEGPRALGKRFRDRYRLARFGRGELLSVALRMRAPIVPCAVVGGEEASPALFGLDALGRALGLPRLPGPLLPLPLPTRFRIRFGRPLLPQSRDLEPAAFTNEVRNAVQALVDDLVRERKSIFF